MSQKKRASVINALLWAGAMIGSALILKGTEQAEPMFLILLVAASTSILLNEESRGCERRMFRRLSGKKSEE